VDELMASIRRDPRHRRVAVLHEAPLDAGRRFPDWSMAYSGPSPYVERHIRPLLDGVVDTPEVAAVVERLLRLVEELTLQAPDDENGVSRSNRCLQLMFLPGEDTISVSGAARRFIPGVIHPVPRPFGRSRRRDP
jgi:hypothetical protein